MSNRNLWWLFLIFALIAYSLVWADAPTQGMSLNAYDLAEWASLHPATHPIQPLVPTRLPSLLLRLQLTILCWIIAFVFHQQGSNHRRLAILAIILLSIAQLPPFEFFLNARDDLNYVQQFILSSVSLASLLFSRWKRLLNYDKRLLAILLIIGMLTTFQGTTESLRLLSSVQQPATWGFGAPLLLLIYIIALLNITAQNLKFISKKD